MMESSQSSSTVKENSAPNKRSNKRSDEGLEVGKARKRKRTCFSKEQVAILDKHYNNNQYPDKLMREIIAAEIGISDKQVHNWFQNKRFKGKRLNGRRHIKTKPVAVPCSQLSEDVLTDTSVTSSHHQMMATQEGCQGLSIHTTVPLHHIDAAPLLAHQMSFDFSQSYHYNFTYFIPPQTSFDSDVTTPPSFISLFNQN